MVRNLDITVIIATHNRDSMLNETLSRLALLECSGINVEFVVVDNNSTDSTKQVIRGFYSRLPIKYFFEPKPGQNCARNRALEDAGLGRIVVFTDDDVVPNRDWLKAILSVCEERPEYGVFGGRIYVIWPNSRIPKWTNGYEVRSLGFAEHCYAESGCAYKDGDHPFSGNFWVRREILTSGRRFDEMVVWSPQNRILATESVFFRRLSQEGVKFFYSPDAAVGHRVTPQQMSPLCLIKRSYSSGRGVAHMQSLCHGGLLEKHPALWRLIRMCAIARLCFRATVSLIPLVMQKPKKMIYAMRWIGYNIESLNIAKDYKRK